MTENTNKLESSPEFYKTLLESTKAIPWKIDWPNLSFSYIGPQIEQLLGWSQDSWKSAQDWAARMHPEDRAWVVDFCISQSKAGTDHEADYRALTKDGNYVWLRDVVHVQRNKNGEVEALVGFMFDISDRKESEQKLLQLQQELEDFSYKDSLTGISNRRMFDKTMELEWAYSRRHQKNISLIIIDIDFFKQYNDCYGHVQGDECLREVSALLSKAINRPRDFLARFGGEEFALILPETDHHSAMQIAEECQKMIAKAQIAHEKSDVAKVLTTSLGVGTITPSQADKSLIFIDQVDKRLYQAKRNGRNNIVGLNNPLSIT